MFYCGQVQTIKYKDKFYKISRLTRGKYACWFRWADDNLEKPLDLAAKYKDNITLMEFFIKQDKKRLSFDDNNVAELFNSYQGQKKLFELLCEEFNPDIPDDMFDNIDWFKIRKVAEGTYPKALKYGDGDWVSPTIREQYLKQKGLITRQELDFKQSWEDIDLSLAKASNFCLLPHMINDMTFPEIAVILRQDKNDKEKQSLGQLGLNFKPDMDLFLAREKLTVADELAIAKMESVD